MIWEVHYNRVTGHFEVEKTTTMLHRYFYLSNIRHDVWKYIISYTVYVISNPTIKNKGLYTPLPTPSHPLESISMDYLLALPSNKHGNNCVFVVIERFYNISILEACKKITTT